MDRATLQQRLAVAESYVAFGGSRVAQQRKMVSDLERDGGSVRLAREILAQFEETYALQVAACNRLRRELVALDRQSLSRQASGG